MLFYIILCVVIANAYRRPTCKESVEFIDREEMADIIFTGTVGRIYRTGPVRTQNYSAMVQVKKVMKCKDNSITHQSVVVIGLGNKKMCHSDLKERDTRIFLVTFLKENYFRLNSSLLRINRDNMDMANAAIQGKMLLKLNFNIKFC